MSWWETGCKCGTALVGLGVLGRHKCKSCCVCAGEFEALKEVLGETSALNGGDSRDIVATLLSKIATLQVSLARLGAAWCLLTVTRAHVVLSSQYIQPVRIAFLRATVERGGGCGGCAPQAAQRAGGPARQRKCMWVVAAAS